MNRFVTMVAAGAALFIGNADDAHALTSHLSKVVSLLEVPIGDCYYFQLSGVTEADPVVPNSPWFTILTTQANAKEMYALLLTVRTTGGTLSRVLTSGSTACGQAQVLTIDL